MVLYKFLSDIVLKGNFLDGGRGRVIETGPGDSCPPRKPQEFRSCGEFSYFTVFNEHLD